MGLDQAAAGIYSGTATIALQSDGAGIDGLGTTPLTAQTITVTGTVNNYAVATIEEISGGGTFGHTGPVYLLNLGTISQGSSVAPIDLGVLNDVAGPADLLSGSFAPNFWASRSIRSRRMWGARSTPPPRRC